MKHYSVIGTTVAALAAILSILGISPVAAVEPTPPMICVTMTPVPSKSPTPKPLTPTPTGRVAPSPTPIIVSSSCRPYAANSPWNTKIPDTAQVHPNNSIYKQSLTGTFTSSVNQYTYPVYVVSNSSPKKTVNVSNVYSNVTNNGASLDKSLHSVTIPVTGSSMPVPAGGDQNLIVVNRDTGDEWGFFKSTYDASRNWTYSGTNGYHYNTSWSGAAPAGFGSRGGGIPYLAGLIQRCDVTDGVIDHALAFAYQNVSPKYVYPATKSDGKCTSESCLPEGARLRLSKSVTDADLTAWGCTGACKMVAKAMQDYGMIVVDYSGHPKVVAEYQSTAKWETVPTQFRISESTVGPLGSHFEKFEVLAH